VGRKFIFFADDTNIFHTNSNISSLNETIYCVLENVCVWFTVNKLTMIITLNPLICYLEAYAHKEFNKQMQNVNMVTQFLGVFIDEHLNWKAQIKYVKSKLSKSTDTLHKCSHLFHINSNSGDTPNKYQQYVLMQKRVIRIVLGARRLDHTNSIFQ